MTTSAPSSSWAHGPTERPSHFTVRPSTEPPLLTTTTSSPRARSALEAHRSGRVHARAHHRGEIRGGVAAVHAAPGEIDDDICPVELLGPWPHRAAIPR